MGDALSFFGLTSKVQPLGSMLNFDADVKKTTARHQCNNPRTHCAAPLTTDPGSAAGMRPLLYSETDARQRGVGWSRAGRRISYRRRAQGPAPPPGGDAPAPGPDAGDTPGQLHVLEWFMVGSRGWEYSYTSLVGSQRSPRDITRRVQSKPHFVLKSWANHCRFACGSFGRVRG